jgi:hypothetical protein
VCERECVSEGAKRGAKRHASILSPHSIPIASLNPYRLTFLGSFSLLVRGLNHVFLPLDAL